ncbi:hypothetical protein D9M73_200780 [compost metagenome]
MVMISPSMPLISCTLTRRRLPSSWRSSWMTTPMAEAICWRMALIGKVAPVIDTIFSIRPNASRAVLAWIVVSEPS